MPIFDQGYQHWEGKLSGHAWRWLAVARRGVRTQLKVRWTRLALLFAWMPSLVLGVFLALWGLLEQKTEDWASWFTFLPEVVRLNPKEFRSEVWTLAFSMFLYAETTAAMILMLIIGPGLISQDLRFNATPLYLSRPLTRFDYFAGKLATIAAFLAAVMILPVVFTYLLGIAFSLSFQVIADTYWIVPASVAYGLIVVAVGGLFMLAISSLSKNSRYVAAVWVGIWLMGGFAAPILSEGLGQKWGPIVAITNDFGRTREALLGTGEAFEEIQEAAQEMAGSVGRPTFLRNPFAAKPKPFQRTRKPRPPRPADAPPTFNPFAYRYPWQWSAYTLTGLAVLSIWILTTRVKSLDRLR